MRYFPQILISIAVLACIALSVKAPLVAILLSLFCIIVALILKKPVLALGIYVNMVPFSNTDLMARTLHGFGGLSIPFVYISFFAFLVIIFKLPVSLPKKELIFVSCLVLLIVTSAVQSVPYARDVVTNLTDSYWVKKSIYFWLYYLLNNLVMPVAIILPVVLIAACVHSKLHVVQIIKSMVLSLFVLSSVLILIFLFMVPDRSDYMLTRSVIEGIFHNHPNSLASFYIIGFPILLAYFLEKKNIMTFLTVVLSLAGVALLYSRTAYAIVAFAVLLLLILSGRKKVIPICLALLIIIVILVPSTVKDRALMGINSNDYTAMKEGSDLSAGRVVNIWIPTLRELSEKPFIIVFGGGSDYYLTMDTHKVTGFDQPHNFYLDTVVKTGLIGLIFILAYLTRLSVIYYRIGKSIPDKMQRNLLNGIIVSLVSFLIRGFTDGSLLPDMGNVFLWILLGLGIAIVKIETAEAQNTKILSWSM